MEDKSNVSISCGGKTEDKRSLGRQCNIKTDLKEIGKDCASWIRLFQDRNEQQTGEEYSQSI